MASQACSLFVEVENAVFERRLAKLLPVMAQLLEDHSDFEVTKTVAGVGVSLVSLCCRMMRMKCQTVKSRM